MAAIEVDDSDRENSKDQEKTDENAESSDIGNKHAAALHTRRRKKKHQEEKEAEEKERERRLAARKVEEEKRAKLAEE